VTQDVGPKFKPQDHKKKMSTKETEEVHAVEKEPEDHGALGVNNCVKDYNC
jgi:hypothetical protein